MVFFIFGCPAPTNNLIRETTFTKFEFTVSNNPNLKSDIMGTIIGAEIIMTVPEGTDLSRLKATFMTMGTSVHVESEEQKSGITENDFSSPVVYTITSEKGTPRSYTVRVTTVTVAVKEKSGFSSATSPGDTAELTLVLSREALTMIYAQNASSITFPTQLNDRGTATLTHRFWMGETEVTNAVVVDVLQWAYDNEKFSSVVSDPNGLGTKSIKYGGVALLDLISPECRVTYNGSGRFLVTSGYENYPVTYISWYGAVIFCNWLTEMRDGNTDHVVYTVKDNNWKDNAVKADVTKSGYRLPSSEEWEYTARYRGRDATNTVKGYSAPYYTRGNSASHATTYHDHIKEKGSGEPGKSANDKVSVYQKYWDGNDWPSRGTSHAMSVKSLGVRSANTLGLYDMSGNVQEWCSIAPSSTSNPMVRGGGWSDTTYLLQIGHEDKSGENPEIGEAFLGFRLCRTAD